MLSLTLHSAFDVHLARTEKPFSLNEQAREVWQCFEMALDAL